MGNCPMTKDVKLTDKQVEKFCSYGCSVDCPKLLKDYIKSLQNKAQA